MDDEQTQPFRDFIPEGEDTGGYGQGGFQDFVPAPEPKPQSIPVEPVVDEPVAPVKPQVVVKPAPVSKPEPAKPVAPKEADGPK